MSCVWFMKKGKNVQPMPRRQQRLESQTPLKYRQTPFLTTKARPLHLPHIKPTRRCRTRIGFYSLLNGIMMIYGVYCMSPIMKQPNLISSINPIKMFRHPWAILHQMNWTWMIIHVFSFVFYLGNLWPLPSWLYHKSTVIWKKSKKNRSKWECACRL